MEQQELQLSNYLRILWKGKWLILLTTVMAIGGVLAFAGSRPAPEPSYRAVATIKVEAVGAPVGVSEPAASSPADRSLNTQILLLQSRNVMERAMRKIAPSTEGEEPVVTALQVEELSNAIGVRSIPNANLLEVTAQGSTPGEAEGRANAVIEAFIDYLKEERTRAIQEALADLNRQILSTNRQERLDELILIIMPELEGELESVVQSVERSFGVLGDLQPQEFSGDPAVALSVEIPRLQQSASALEAVSGNLQAVQARLGEGPVGTPTSGNSSLALEASRMRGVITELDVIYNELQGIRSQLNLPQQAPVNDSLAARAEGASDTLKQASVQLGAVRSSSLEQSREVNSILEYVNSVASDLQKITTQIQESSTNNSGIPERERAALQGQIMAYTIGLSTASKDLEDIRSELEIGEYGKILAARGHIETASTQLKSLSTALDSSAGSASAHDTISEVMSWTQEARGNLQAVTDSFLGLQVAPGTEAERDAAVRASSGIENVSLTLDIGSAKLRSLAPRIADPLLQGRINAAAGRLTTAQRSAAESSSRLRAIAQVGGASMADRIRAVRERIQIGAEELRAVAEGLRVNNSTPGMAANVGTAGQAYSDTSSVAWSLDVASRQLQGLVQGSTDPLLVGEVGSLEQQLSTVRGDVLAISQRLDNIDGAGRSGGGKFAEIALIENKLKTAATSLRSALETYREEQGKEEGISANDVTKIKDSIDVATAILGRVGEDLARLQLSETDSFRFGQLVVMLGRVSRAQSQSQEVATQLQSLQGGSTSEDREMRQLRRELELSLLQPQETGITKVDSAVSPQAVGRTSFLFQGRFPLAAVAGAFLGGLAVIFKVHADPTVRRQDQLRDRLGLTSLGVIPRGKAPGNPYPPMVASGDQPIFSEALQLVATGLSRPIANGVRCFLITSAEPKDGKTMLAVNLAHVLAHYGHRVLLVDGNLRKPEVAEVLGLPDDEGLSKALAEQASPLDYVVETGGFYVLPGGKAPSNSVELLSSPAMVFFLEQAQRRYDVVLVDGPPTLGFAEVKAQSRGINASILVVRAGSTRVDAIQEAKTQLEEAGIPVVASVLNFAPDDECRHLHHHEKYVADSSETPSWSRITGIHITS